jgi:very-short-patch-repair endonuclease
MALRIHKERGSHARQMRREPTEPEKRLWRHLSASQLGGFKFRRQSVIGTYICDFCCPGIGLIVEIDGDTHDADADRERDAVLVRLGYIVMRATNQDVMRNIEGVLQAILARAITLPERRYREPLPSKGGAGVGASEASPEFDNSPTPTPPLEGRGVV